MNQLSNFEVLIQSRLAASCAFLADPQAVPPIYSMWRLSFQYRFVEIYSDTLGDTTGDTARTPLSHSIPYYAHRYMVMVVKCQI